MKSGNEVWGRRDEYTEVRVRVSDMMDLSQLEAVWMGRLTSETAEADFEARRRKGTVRAIYYSIEAGDLEQQGG